MLQVARLAPTLLGDAADSVRAFFDDHAHDGGGFVDRAGAADLYYTVFALEGLLALRADVPVAATLRYLEGFGDGAGLDLVHLCCLARGRAALINAVGDSESPSTFVPSDLASAMATRLETFRCSDGGYAGEPGGAAGTVYHSFMTLGAYQDLRLENDFDPEHVEAVVRIVEKLRTDDGAYANNAGMPVGSTTVTAAAVTLLRYLGRPIPDGVAEWLLARFHEEGGFLAAPRAPMPDLLSTATALHALVGLRVELEDEVRERCLDFVDTLWTGRSFCGHWADDEQDVEYAYYALLALGHLSVR